MAQILFPVFIVVEDSKNMTTFGETRELRRKIAQESWFWESSFKVIAKHMLVMQFGISGVWEKPDEEIVYICEQKIQENGSYTSSSDANLGPDDVFKKFCESNLRLTKEPRSALLELYLEASKDLKNLSENLKRIENYRKLNKSSYEGEFADAYKEANDKKIKDIVSFLESDEIKKCALQRVFENRTYLSDICGYPNYKLSINIAALDITNFSILSNKVNFFPLGSTGKIQELKSLCKSASESNDEEPKLHLTQELEDIIREYGVVEKISEKIEQNHYLRNRSEIIREALSAFENKKYLVFLSLTPLQIEGIFGDFCEISGIGKPAESLTKTIDYITSEGKQGLTGISLFEEWGYFRYKFPVTRNEVAHGLMTDVNFKKQFFSNIDKKLYSCYLMLDLYDVCEMVSNDELALNRVSRCLEDIESITDTDVDQESLELDTERTKGDLFLSRLFFKKIKQKTQDSIIKNMRKNMSELVKGFENQIENYFKDEEILDYLRFSEYLENLIESCKECEGDDVILLSAIETIAHGPT